MRSRWMIAGVALTLTLGLAVTADRIVAARAAGRLADRLRCAGHLDVDPDVSFTAMPFLPQLMSRNIGTVHVQVPHVTVGQVTAAVDATAHDVRLSDTGTMRAGSLTAEVALAYGSDSSGRLTVPMRVELLGEPRSVIVHAAPRLADGTLTLRPEEVEIPALGLRIPAARLGDRAQARTVDLPPLPAGLQYTKAGVTSRGLQLTVTGSDLRIAAAASPGCP
ncbi:hypothetical protein ACWT_3617 [Actinoplanes sp. SE50]|uniref:LmeA family phospholipid-binding protein n=1 Tax=unclassified Actinoplanes TaxID=2626549 RepID=UPI00023EC475|nr:MULTISPECIES: DUF2993 domain-containing protein [unclassified Actinoplanes]AEV84640.1 hypothetical protein ACPL_3745 [Actinoplanes sp. SE50/110]ATO83032.1 hypothetical protein ACWT_3617 [Actinoplanes sp. SE50]SLM00440.1 hypothetical protein ACSP50_3672 [Actinoplanes sp. SE50/110]